MEPDKPQQKPWLPMIAGALGLILTVALVAFIAWQAISQPNGKPPVIIVKTETIEPQENGYVVRFVARNLAPNTAAAVLIEGTLSGAGERPIVSQTQLGYVAGESKIRGGLFFPMDPRTGQLELRALGYTEP